jgi:hypothetical protein
MGGFNFGSSNSWKNVGNETGGWFKDTGNGTKSWFEDAGNDTKSWFRDDLGGKKTGEWIKGAAGDVGQFFENAVGGFGDTLNTIFLITVVIVGGYITVKIMPKSKGKSE